MITSSSPLKLRELYPYQKEFLSTSQSRFKIPLFWQMRLGKSLAVIRKIKECSPSPERVLIICPKSVIYSWSKELQAEGIPYVVFNTTNKHFHTVLHPVWAITNYETLRSHPATLQLLPWDAVIVDESPRIKNPATQLTKILTLPTNFPLSSPEYNHFQTEFSLQYPQFRFILTGTPAPESYLDYFSQFKFLFGKMGRWKDFHQFRYDNFNLGTRRGSATYVPKVGFIKAVANYLEKYAYTLSRKQIGIDLPHVYEKRYVELSAQHRKMYDDFESSWYIEFLDQLSKELGQDDTTPTQSPKQLETKFATVAQSYLYQMAIGFPKKTDNKTYHAKHKLNELTSILYGELQNEKVVIWCQHLKDIEEIYKEIRQKHNRIPAIINGKTSTEKLTRILDSFQASSPVKPFGFNDIDTLICQIKKASLGMDLSAADVQIFFSRSWSSSDNQQATDRLIHPEKKNQPGFSNILTIDIITENTIDEDLHNALIEKRANSSVYKLFLERTNYGKLKKVKV